MGGRRREGGSVGVLGMKGGSVGGLRREGSGVRREG